MRSGSWNPRLRVGYRSDAKMKPSFKIYSAIGIIITVSAVVGWYLYPKPLAYSESFEKGFGEWVADADVPSDPNNPGHQVAWNVSRVTSLVHSGQYSVELYIDGRQDDGTVWIERRISVERNSQIRVKISFQFYSEHESFNAIAGVCAYAEISDPEVEGDFAILGQANEVAGWKTYTYTTTFNKSSSDKIWVALGITVLWETHMTYNIDDIKVAIS